MTGLRLLIWMVAAFACIGCGAENANPPASKPAEAVQAAPTSTDDSRQVTDLSQISSVNSIVAPTPQATPAHQPTPSAGSNPNAETQRNIERLFVASANQTRYREGPTPPPGDTTLLNDKARQFSDFSFAMLNQTMTVAREIEPDRLQGRKLPDTIGAIELVATMDSQGRLRDIAIESHSGDHQVDQIIIDACKSGIWSRNPPSQAIDKDGKYRVRVRGRVVAYSFDRNGVYHYRTELGLELL